MWARVAEVALQAVLQRQQGTGRAARVAAHPAPVVAAEIHHGDRARR